MNIALFRFQRAVLCGAIVLLLASCASPEPINRIEVDQRDALKLKFSVYGDPGIRMLTASEREGLKGQALIRAGARRYAEKRLAELGMCSQGFVGPDVVDAENNNRLQRHFSVRCLPGK